MHGNRRSEGLSLVLDWCFGLVVCFSDGVGRGCSHGTGTTLPRAKEGTVLSIVLKGLVIYAREGGLLAR